MPRPPLDCSHCDHCCNYISFTLPKRGTSKENMQHLIEFYKARGCHIEEDTFSVYITVYTPCPQKIKTGEHFPTAKGCMLHTKGRKPEPCKTYDCRNDPWLPAGGNYKKGKDRP